MVPLLVLLPSHASASADDDDDVVVVFLDTFTTDRYRIMNDNGDKIRRKSRYDNWFAPSSLLSAVLVFVLPLSVTLSLSLSLKQKALQR